MQNFIATGNLGSDVEMRYQPSGDAVANFSLAINKRYTSKDGQKVEKTIWVRVAVWRQLAENCAKYLHKGSKVLVQGELEPINIFTKRDGAPGASYELTAHSVEFLSERDDQGNGEAATATNVAKAVEKRLNTRDEDDSIPF